MPSLSPKKDPFERFEDDDVFGQTPDFSSDSHALDDHDDDAFLNDYDLNSTTTDFDHEELPLGRSNEPNPFAAEAPIESSQPMGLNFKDPLFSQDETNEDLGSISIPRIGIHFFLERNDSQAACEAASGDRRMSRAQCQVRSGGIAEGDPHLSKRTNAVFDHR